MEDFESPWGRVRIAQQWKAFSAPSARAGTPHRPDPALGHLWVAPAHNSNCLLPRLRTLPVLLQFGQKRRQTAYA